MFTTCTFTSGRRLLSRLISTMSLLERRCSARKGSLQATRVLDLRYFFTPDATGAFRRRCFALAAAPSPCGSSSESQPLSSSACSAGSSAASLSSSPSSIARRAAAAAAASPPRVSSSSESGSIVQEVRGSVIDGGRCLSAGRSYRVWVTANAKRCACLASTRQCRQILVRTT